MENLEVVNKNTLITGRLQVLFRKVTALLGFSRFYIGFFVLIQSSLGAILALSGWPSWDIILVGAIACLSGSYSLVAFNDLLDIPIDKSFIENKKKEVQSFDVASAFERHPVAKGIISFQLGLVWVLLMTVISMVSIAYVRISLLWILPTIAFFVAMYSYLSLRSSLKVIAVAIAVTLGGVGGWLAVSSDYGILFWFFLTWTFLWEIGGRNIPNDFNDIEQDCETGVKTFPVLFGRDVCAGIIVVFLLMTTIVSIPMVWLATNSYNWALASLLLGVYFLLLPGWRLKKESVPEISQKLYNRSAFYPLAMFLLLVAAFYI